MYYYALVFLRMEAAQSLGHVGWAFTKDCNCFGAGAVENPGSMPVALPGRTGFWQVDTSDPVTTFREAALPYDEYKVIRVDPSAASPEKALAAVGQVAASPYLVATKNCMDSTYQVLEQFGIRGLPLPSKRWSPNQWYLRLPGEPFLIGRNFYWQGHSEIVSTMSELAELAAAANTAIQSFGATPELQERLRVVLSIHQSVQDAARQEQWERVVAEADLLFRIFRDII